MTVLVVVAAVAVSIILMEIPSEILPGGHLPEFLVFGKEPGHGHCFSQGEACVPGHFKQQNEAERVNSSDLLCASCPPSEGPVWIPTECSPFSVSCL